MGFLGNFLNKLGQKAIKDTAENVLKYYRLNASRHPNLSKQDLFRMLLEDRYTILKTMKKEDINNVVTHTDNLVALTLAIIAYENPPAIHVNTDSTLEIVTQFYAANAPEEFQIFNSDPDLPYAFIIAYGKVKGRL